jgi:hypothetical protein
MKELQTTSFAIHTVRAYGGNTCYGYEETPGNKFNSEVYQVHGGHILATSGFQHDISHPN